MEAKYDGKCNYCKGLYAAGTDIVAIRPRGKRRRWLKYHRACHKALSRGIAPNRVTVRYECPRCGRNHHGDKRPSSDSLRETARERRFIAVR